MSASPGRPFCLGAPLARLEARVALQGLLARFDHLELEPAPLRWRPELVIHGLRALPLRYSRGEGGGEPRWAEPPGARVPERPA